MEYTMKNFMADEFIITCKEKSEAEAVMKLFIEEGIKWNGGDSLSVSETYWDEHKSEFYYSHAGALQYGTLKYAADRYPKVSYQDFMLTNKSTKEKVLEIIGVKIGEKFNLSDDDYNPYYFDKEFILRDNGGDRRTSKVIDILWGNNKIEKLPDPNAEINKYIELLSSTTPLTKNIREGILVSLKEILELKEPKSA